MSYSIEEESDGRYRSATFWDEGKAIAWVYRARFGYMAKVGNVTTGLFQKYVEAVSYVEEAITNEIGDFVLVAENTNRG